MTKKEQMIADDQTARDQRRKKAGLPVEGETITLEPDYVKVMRFMADALARDAVTRESWSRRNFIGSFIETVRYVHAKEPKEVQFLIDELQEKEG